MFTINNPRTCGMVNPIGISISSPKLSWMLESNETNVVQTAYRLVVSTSKENLAKTENLFYDSGVIESQETFCYIGRPVFTSGLTLFWMVKAWNNKGEESEWSDIQSFETGLLFKEDWVAQWAEPRQMEYIASTPTVIGDSLATPARHFDIPESEFDRGHYIRKELTVSKEVKRARLYATAHGVYKAYLNGERVGNLELMPENTCYQKMLQVQTYDITKLLRKGENVFGAVLGDGWWRGHVSCFGNKAYHGTKVAILFQINIEYSDGSSDVFGSDESTKAYYGELLFSDYGMGERIDMRKAITGWNRPGIPDGEWEPVDIKEYGYANLVGQNAEPIKIIKILKAQSFKKLDDGSLFIDFGQVISGNCRIIFDGTNQRGKEILISYCEQADKDGNFIYNFSGYHQHEDYFVLSGEPCETYEPFFALRGFRWVRIKGYEGTINIENIEARLIASDVQKISSLTTSDARINKLIDCIQWSLINNLASVPTDNPDRERDGWTGDFTTISATMFYNYGLESFAKRWFHEAALEQHSDGCMTKVVPMDRPIDDGSSAGWGDCAIIAPWEAYNAFGDKRILSENYPMMQKWMDYVVRRMEIEPDPNQKRGDIFVGGWNMDMAGWYKNWSPSMSEEHRKNFRYLWDADFAFGDWMVPSGNIDENGEWTYFSKDVCETFTPLFFSAYSSELMARIAAELGKTEDAVYYRSLNKNIKNAVIEEVYKTGVIPENRFQGVLALSLKAGFYPENEKSVLINRLIDVIYNIDAGKLNTGFSSIEHLMFELARNGHPKAIYDLLFNERIPSYMYMIDHGATAIWETWRNISEDGTVNVASYTQFAIGSIGRWLMAGVGAISPLEPGYKKIKIEPVIDPSRRITFADASYSCPYGEINVHWEVSGKTVSLALTVPVNTTAEVFFYGSSRENITVGSGKHSFTYELLY